LVRSAGRSGAGTLNTQSKSVQAAGTYTHKSPNGNVLETGVWIAGELVSFDSYGVAPGALRRQGVGLGPHPLGHKRLSMSFGVMPTGGLAVFRIRLLAMSGVTKNAVLQVNCAVGDVPRERSVEGIRITFENPTIMCPRTSLLLCLKPHPSPPERPESVSHPPLPRLAAPKSSSVPAARTPLRTEPWLAVQRERRAECLQRCSHVQNCCG
jgi:hypothetical protein